MSMEKNRSSSSRNGGCGKIFRAVRPCCYQNDSPHRSSTTRTQVPPTTDTVDQAKRGSHNHSYIEDRFTDYINRAKVKIRTTSNASEAMKLDKRHSTTKVDKTSEATKAADKTFSEYINRAKAKIRTMSGIGGGKNDTSKF